MTNFEKITETPAALQQFLADFRRVVNVLPYINFSDWCNSSDPEYNFQGPKAKLSWSDDEYIEVGKEVSLGKTYSTLVNPKSLGKLRVPTSNIVYIRE